MEGLSTYLVTVPLQDRPGALAHVARVLGRNLVNIIGFTVDFGHARFLTNNATRAHDVLAQAGFPANAEEVVELRIENRSGELARLAETLGEAAINIRCAFGIGQGSTGTIYLSVDDMDRAGPILDQLGIGRPVLHSGLGRI